MAFITWFYWDQGWYAMEVEMQLELELCRGPFCTFHARGGLSVLRVDLCTMKQTNLDTGTERHIIRVETWQPPRRCRRCGSFSVDPAQLKKGI